MSFSMKPLTDYLFANDMREEMRIASEQEKILRKPIRRSGLYYAMRILSRYYPLFAGMHMQEHIENRNYTGAAMSAAVAAYLIFSELAERQDMRMKLYQGDREIAIMEEAKQEE